MYKSIEIMKILLEQDFKNKKHFADELNRLCSLVDCEIANTELTSQKLNMRRYLTKQAQVDKRVTEARAKLAARQSK